MKNKKMLKNKITAFITILLVPFIFLLTSGFTRIPEQKNETVYVNLNTDGSVRETEIVNWLSILGLNDTGKNSYVDFGEYDSIKNMLNDSRPSYDGSRITWDSDAFNEGNLFYAGVTQKDIPVDIEIKYFLNGVEIPGKELAGKTGNLKIEIKIKNKLKRQGEVLYTDYFGKSQHAEKDCYVPLIVQTSIKADVTVFSGIEAKDATMVLTGKEMNISFADFPFPDSFFALEMYGKNISLEPINIVVIPSEVPIPDDLEDSKKNLEEFDSGLIEMTDGSDKIIDGSEKLQDGLVKLKNGSQELVDAISEINHGLYTLSDKRSTISNGFEEIGKGLNELNQKGGEIVNATQQLTSNLENIQSGLDKTANGAAGLSKGLDTMTGAAAGLQEFPDNLKQIVQQLSLIPVEDIYKEGYQNLLGTLLYLADQETAAFSSLQGGLQEINGGMKDLSGGLKNLAGGVGEYKGGMEQFSTNMSAMAQGFDQLASGHNQLASAWNQYGDAISKLFEGTNELYNEIHFMPDDIAKITDGNLKIKDGIKELKEDGIIEIHEQVIENIDKVNEGIAIKEELKKLSDNYSSFMDSRNTTSRVQFIMQTDEIKMAETVSEKIVDTAENETLWQRFLKLFKN